jgi:hypothetical protein
VSAAAAIDGGQSYLLARIRACELVSRAPADSPEKGFDGCGEPFLAVDPIIAVGDRLTDEDRQSLAGRLIQSQWMGAWDYKGKQGIDVDTTSSAIRALDRLGHQVPLNGLNLFFNRRAGLFRTFGHPSDVIDLQFPPQTVRKHLGSHPCVLANVFLLLRERGRLSNINHDLLRRLQKPDGTWFSYFYPSPFYSTRLFTELLTSLDEKYDPYMRSTLGALLARAPTGSPTQDAEILISLDRLRRRFVSDRQTTTEKAAGLMQQILARQLDDGSWPGEVIWNYQHRTNSTVVVGFDYFRVRSTALCVRALKLWASATPEREPVRQRTGDDVVSRTASCAPATIAHAAYRAGFQHNELSSEVIARPQANNLIGTIQWLCAMPKSDPELISRVLAAQRADGAWPLWPWVTGGGNLTPYWGSAAVTTALAIEALSRQAGLANAPS